VNVRTAHVPPHSIEAEMSTLGSMMLDQHAIEKVAEILRPDDFYREAHRILYEVILSLAERHIPVDLLTVQEELRRRDQLEEIGGLPALVQIVESVPTASNAEYYARIVEEKAILRRLIRAAHDILQLADDPELELQDVIDRAEQAIFSVAQRRLGRYFSPIDRLLLQALEHIERVQEMRAKCRRLKAERNDLALIVIDYLQLIRSHSRRAENRNQEIGEIARALKGLAREFEVPVLVLSQLSRAVERREEKRPILSDLRDSGSIEAEADVVLFIHRPNRRGDELDDDEPREAGVVPTEEVEIIIAKQRNGPTGRISLGFQPAFSRFVTLERATIPDM
jgi:replicative DNA helicase